jgi:DNA-binding LacI/PurR family transcriptional regulator
MLLQMIKRETIDATVQVLRPELVVRESTAKTNRE